MVGKNGSVVGRWTSHGQHWLEVVDDVTALVRLLGLPSLEHDSGVRLEVHDSRLRDLTVARGRVYFQQEKTRLPPAAAATCTIVARRTSEEGDREVTKLRA